MGVDEMYRKPGWHWCIKGLESIVFYAVTKHRYLKYSVDLRKCFLPHQITIDELEPNQVLSILIISAIILDWKYFNKTYFNPDCLNNL